MIKHKNLRNDVKEMKKFHWFTIIEVESQKIVSLDNTTKELTHSSITHILLTR